MFFRRNNPPPFSALDATLARQRREREKPSTTSFRPGDLVGASLNLEARAQLERDRRERERPPTEAEVRRELNVSDDVEVRIIPFNQLGGAKSIEEAIHQLTAGRGRTMPDDSDGVDTAAVTGPEPAGGYAGETFATPRQTEPVTPAEARHDTPQPKPELTETEKYRFRQRTFNLAKVTAEVLIEVLRAQQKHAPMHSIHEAFGVIYEEFNVEFAEAMHKDDYAQARKEAIQVAAMAVRFILDVADQRPQEC